MATEKTEKLDCAAIRPLLSAFADGETTAAETSRVKRHLASCASCASELAFARAMHSALFAAPRETPAPELFERIAAATYARPTLRERIAQWLTPAPTRWAMGTALAAGLLLAVTLPRMGRENTTPLAGKNNSVSGNRESGVAASVPSPAPSSANVVSLPNDKGDRDKAVTRPDKVVAVVAPHASKGTEPTKASLPQTPNSELRIPSAAPVRVAIKENPATTNGAETKAAANEAPKHPQTRVASLTPKPVRPVDAALPLAHVSPPIAKSATKSPSLSVAEVNVPKSPSPAAPVHLEPAPAPTRTVEKPEPDTRVAAKEPEPATGRQVAMVEATRTAPRFSVNLRNAGVGRREINVPSPPNMGNGDTAPSLDTGRSPLIGFGDNGKVASLK